MKGQPAAVAVPWAGTPRLRRARRRGAGVGSAEGPALAGSSRLAAVFGAGETGQCRGQVRGQPRREPREGGAFPARAVSTTCGAGGASGAGLRSPARPL